MICSLMKFLRSHPHRVRLLGACAIIMTMFWRHRFDFSTRVVNLFWFSLLFVVALWPRLTAVSRYVTPDELIWVFRSVQFRQALLSANWLDTITTGHPGVLTTWLGSAAITLQLWLRPSTLPTYQWITQLAWFSPENTPMFSQLYTFLTIGRLFVAISNSLGILAIFALSQKLYGRRPATLIALCLALDPFVAGLAGLLHVDGLMTTFTTLSLLSLALSLRHPSQWRWPLLSGATAALAVLAKTPAILLPPFAALFFLLSLLHGRGQPIPPRLQQTIRQGASWLLSYLLTLFACLPALWKSPLHVWNQMRGTSVAHLEEALRPSFFLGQTTFDPGPLFYPVTITFRLGPVLFIGLLLALYWLVRQQKQPQWPTFSRHQLSQAVFWLWPILFLLALTVAAKKFDRYAIPIWPALTILAVLAWTKLPLYQQHGRRLATALIATQALFLASVWPYPLTAVNPLLGGNLTVPHLFDVGWGEAEGAAARWLARQPETAQQTAVSWFAPAIAPFFPGYTLPTNGDLFPQATYIILPATERETPPPNAFPIHTVHFNGLDRAIIYQQAQPEPLLSPILLPEPVTFANELRLLGSNSTVYPRQIELVLLWQLVQPSHGRYTVKIDLKDEQGQLWSSMETALLNDSYFYPEHWPAAQRSPSHYQLPIPLGLPPATYQLELSLFNAETSAQLPVLAADGTFAGTGHTLGQIQTAPPAQPTLVTAFNPPLSSLSNWANGRLQLLTEADFPPKMVAQGDRLLLDLYWQANAPLPADAELEISLGEVSHRYPLSRFSPDQWRVGDIFHEKTAVPIPTDMPAGTYSLTLRPWLDGRALDPVQTSPITVTAIDRLFTLPADIPFPQDDSFAGLLHMHGFAAATQTAQPGQTVPITLYWQVEQKPSHLLTSFIHIRQADGQLVAQSDQWPAGLPSTLWADQQILIDAHQIALPPTLAPGSYSVVVGVYNPDTGLRLPAFAADGRSHAHDELILPFTLQVTSP